jgi:hypothetical protein
VHPQDFQKIPVIVNGDDPVSHQDPLGGWAAGCQKTPTTADYAKMEHESSQFANFLELQPEYVSNVVRPAAGEAGRKNRPKWNSNPNLLKLNIKNFYVCRYGMVSV